MTPGDKARAALIRAAADVIKRGDELDPAIAEALHDAAEAAEDDE